MQNIKRIHLFAAAIFFLSALLVVLLSGKSFSEGVQEGLRLASGVFIPAMLPYYFLVAFVCQSQAKLFIRHIFRPLCSIASLNAASSEIILMGFLGGYPAGAMAVGEACRSGELSVHDASRLMLFCTNAGPGFIIGAVGQVMLGSLRAGILLYCAHLLASLTVAVFTCAPHREISTNTKSVLRISGFFEAFTSSVTKACLSCLYAAGFIALTCGLIAVCTRSSQYIGKEICAAVSALLEVTKGCLEITHLTTLSTQSICILLSATLGFGGISVLLQLASFCGEFVPFKKLLRARLYNALLGAGYCFLLCCFFGTPEIHTSAVQTAATISSYQQTSAYLLIAIGFTTAISKLFEQQYSSVDRSQRHNNVI